FEVYKFVSTAQIAAGGGGVVGRQKMSEDTSPIPRDRLIFDYDYFSGASLTPGGIDVHRIVVGFEKTYLDGRASLEVRMPFASTLDSTSTVGLESRNTEIGDVRITPRFLAYSSETVNVGTGLGIYLPTSADTRVRNGDGSDLARFSNDSVTLSPYLGVLFTPNDRVFSQEWISFDFDTGGSALSANVDGNGLQSLGRYRNGTQMNLDAQIGYWLINPSDQAAVTGLAPFLELHYGSAVTNASMIQAGDLQIGGGSRGDELNLTAGVMVQLGERLNLQVGASVPVINSDSRNFEWQVGFRLNYFFGASAALPSRAAFIP
ncbi:MAG TPA: transporter, partial [Gemmataceae bacterium]|nr:transporter [Gemmataceae bacterium]